MTTTDLKDHLKTTNSQLEVFRPCFNRNIKFQTRHTIAEVYRPDGGLPGVDFLTAPDFFDIALIKLGMF